MMSRGVQVRRAKDSDLSAILSLCALALRWKPGEPNEQLFRWKHLENPFGRSPMWVAEADGRMVGFRSMLKWRFRRLDGTTISAVRAVDTATHPEYRRLGVFSALTVQAVKELTDEGVGFIFNTPNEESRTGYLKMGWVDAGRVPIVVRPVSIAGLVRMASAHSPASKWSDPSGPGDPGFDPSSWQPGGEPKHGFVTDLSREVLAWRFRDGPVGYRTLTQDGAGVTFRVRTRGLATELAIVNAWGPEERVQLLIDRAIDDSDVSYVIAARHTPGCSKMAPASFVGPRLTLRALAVRPPPAEELGLTLGDVELF